MCVLEGCIFLFCRGRLCLRGGRGLAPDPEDESDVDSNWILPEERRTQESSEGFGVEEHGSDSDRIDSSKPETEKASALYDLMTQSQ